MAILVIYASHYGQTFAIANHIAQHLRDGGFEVELANASAGVEMLPPPEDYDAVILGSRVEMGKHARDVLAYIAARHHSLAKRPTGFFSVSMAAASGGDDPQGYLRTTFERLAWWPAEAVAFAGAIPYRRYGWFMRRLMKLVNKRAGHTTDTSRDHVFTDFAAVDGFADRIAARVTARSAVASL